jgi:hypothetical protein
MRGLRVHHSHPDLAVFFIVVGSVLVLFVVVVAGAVRWQVRRNAGPLQDRWYAARRGLTIGQRWQVRWANMRHRPVGRPELGPAQLACTRYAAEAFDRAPMVRNRWIRIMVPALEFAAAAFQLVPALTSPQGRVSHLIAGSVYLATGVIWCYLSVHGLSRARQKLTRLQQQLQHQYGPREDAT